MHRLIHKRELFVLGPESQHNDRQVRPDLWITVRGNKFWVFDGCWGRKYREFGKKRQISLLGCLAAFIWTEWPRCRLESDHWTIGPVKRGGEEAIKLIDYYFNCWFWSKLSETSSSSRLLSESDSNGIVMKRKILVQSKVISREAIAGGYKVYWLLIDSNQSGWTDDYRCTCFDEESQPNGSNPDGSA